MARALSGSCSDWSLDFSAEMELEGGGGKEQRWRMWRKRTKLREEEEEDGERKDIPFPLFGLGEM